MPSLKCSALIFDLDGVLLDSNDLYEQHWKIWAEQNSISFSHIQAVHHGRPVRSTIEEVAPHLDAVDHARQYIRSLNYSPFLDRVAIFPGVHDLLNSLPLHSWAIATSAPRDFARKLINFLGLPLPQVLITGDDVSMGKPHPMPYLLAAKGLDVCADRCVVVEDAPVGIDSAKAAGAYVIGVLTTNDPSALYRAHTIAESIEYVRAIDHGECLQISWEEARVFIN